MTRFKAVYATPYLRGASNSRWLAHIDERAVGYLREPVFLFAGIPFFYASNFFFKLADAAFQCEMGRLGLHCELLRLKD